MKKVCFVQEAGYTSSGSNLWNLAKSHQASKKHINHHTMYKLLGNADIACALDEAHRREIAMHNHNATRFSKLLQHHIDVVVFLAAQGLAFRGHDESEASSNRGNFLELMDLLGNYSHELRMFLDRDRITYTSHDPQNEFIKCVYEEVKEEIKKRVEKSMFVSVMMDDTSDFSNVEQSAVSVRLINNGEVEEHLLGLVSSSNDQSASGLTTILLNTLKEYDVTPEKSSQKLIAQSYDGAPTMSGALNGVQKKIKDKFPFAFYNHCVAHRMSLCAAQSADKIQEVVRFFDTVDKIVTFFRSSPKRTHNLGRSVPRPGDTRWLSRDASVGVIDSCYEEIGTQFFVIMNDASEKASTQATARGLGIQMQHVEFVFLLKLYRKLFEHCTPVILAMQKPTLDPVQLKSMIEDFQRVLANVDLDRIWNDTLAVDPELPEVRARRGWRCMEQGTNGAQSTHESWKNAMKLTAGRITTGFSDQLAWRFENLEKFKWVDLVNPRKFDERKTSSSENERSLIKEVSQLYPFVVPDAVALENNLNVLYNSTEISLLLKSLIRERDLLVQQKKAKRRRLAENCNEGTSGSEEQQQTIEERDEFEMADGESIDVESVKEGKASLQDLLMVIKKAELEEALPQAMTLLELAVATPLTSVHCERVFSRMKRVVSPARSSMLQERKEELVFLQVEHKVLRWLAEKEYFKEQVISRFKSANSARFTRLSRK